MTKRNLVMMMKSLDQDLFTKLNSLSDSKRADLFDFLGGSEMSPDRIEEIEDALSASIAIKHSLRSDRRQ